MFPRVLDCLLIGGLVELGLIVLQAQSTDRLKHVP